MAYTETPPGIKIDDALVKTEINWLAHCPHWMVGRNGWASLDVRGHTRAGWLSLDAIESYTSNSGRVQSKRTMLTLDRAQAERLRDMLNLVLGV